MLISTVHYVWMIGSAITESVGQGEVDEFSCSVESMWLIECLAIETP